MDFHISQFLSPGRKEFVKGTLLLTGAGLFCRVLGFFYRIYMSRTIGAEGLGLYNMIHPLFSIAFAVCAGSIQTALSQYIAASQEKGPAVFKCGLFLSLSLSVIPLLLLGISFRNPRQPVIFRYWQFPYHLPVSMPASTAIIME